MIAGPAKAFIRVQSALRFLRQLGKSLTAGGRWTVSESGDAVMVKEGLRERFPGQVVPGGGGVFVEPFYAGGPFEYRPVTGRVAGAGWLCIKVEHVVVWSVGDSGILRNDALVSVDLVMLPELVDATPATLIYTTSPDFEITSQTNQSVAYYPLAYVNGNGVSHVRSTANTTVGSGVKNFNPAVLEIDET